MKNITSYIVLSVGILVSTIVYIRYSYYPIHDIVYYYGIMQDQENIGTGVSIDISIDKDIMSCNRKTKCLQELYKNLTLKNGVDAGFGSLIYMQKKFPKLIPSCHYISHGIGHAALVINKNNVEKTFAILQDSDIYKNIATCGNGYFHGVIEEYAKDVYEVDPLISLLQPICKNSGICFHGIGHAALIQMKYDIGKSLAICDGVTSDIIYRSDCYTGIFMGIASEKYYTELAHIENGKLIFDMCDRYPRPYREACYGEQSGIYETIAKDPMDFGYNIGSCKNISDPLDRMGCIKVFAIRAVRIARYMPIQEMCENTSTPQEAIICTATVAYRVGKSIDKTRSTEVYISAIRDICRTTKINLQKECIDKALDTKNSLFYTSARDLE